MLSLKKEAFINQPMELKETTSVGGIGKIFGEKLKMQGYHYAYQFYWPISPIKEGR